MKLTIEKQTLAACLAKIIGVINPKNTMPILQNVYLETEGDKLTIRATDLDIEVITRVECMTLAPGAVTVNARVLSEGVKKFNAGGTVSLDMGGDKINITQGRRKFNLATLDAEQYPKIASDEYDATFQMAACDIARLFGKAAFAISPDETRYMLNGVYFHNTPEGIAAVSTDGHRLAKVWVNQFEDFTGVIVPKKTVAEVRKAFDIGDVHISVSPSKIKFDAGDTVIVSKVIDGTFPDYSRIIPKGHANTFRVDAVEFANAASAVALVCEDRKSRGVTMSIGDDQVKLTVGGSLNDAEDVVDADVTGEACRIGFNSQYLADALAQAEGGDVDIHYSIGVEPILMMPKEDNMFLAVIMPMRT